jgi:hypothetical protein
MKPVQGPFWVACAASLAACSSIIGIDDRYQVADADGGGTEDTRPDAGISDATVDGADVSDNPVDASMDSLHSVDRDAAGDVASDLSVRDDSDFDVRDAGTEEPADAGSEEHDAATVFLWEYLPSGRAISVATSEDGGTWVVGTDNNIYVFTDVGNFPWGLIPLTDPSQSGSPSDGGPAVPIEWIAASQEGNLWALDVNGHPGEVTGTMFVQPSLQGVGSAIGVGNGDIAFIVDTNHALREWSVSTWLNLQGDLQQLSVWDAPSGSLLLPMTIFPDNSLSDYGSGGWVKFDPAPPGNMPTLIADHLVISGGLLFEYSETNGAWESLGPPPVSASTIVQISASYHYAASTKPDGVDAIWLVDNMQNIWRAFASTAP